MGFFLTNARTKNQMSHPGKWPLVGNQLWGLGCAKLLPVLSGALGFELLNLRGWW